MVDEKPFEISGGRINLSEGRKVWAGEHGESWYIEFTSREGNIRKLRISYEAADALIKLLSGRAQQITRFAVMIDDVGNALKWEHVDEPPPEQGAS